MVLRMKQERRASFEAMAHIYPDDYPWKANEKSLVNARTLQPGRGPVSRRKWEDHCYNMLALRVFDAVSSFEPNPWRPSWSQEVYAKQKMRLKHVGITPSLCQLVKRRKAGHRAD
eukprot:6016068-Amphidinium_carterae.1